MTSSRFDFGSTSKTLNLSFLQFNERSESENLELKLDSYIKKIEFDLVNDLLIFVCLANKLSSSPNLDSIIK